MEDEYTNLTRLTTTIIKTFKTSKKKRVMLGIIGIPGSGKSTLAARLTKRINEFLNQDIAIVVPMDGFHLHNTILSERGLLPVKGKPETFDAAGFVARIKQIAADNQEKIYCPAYDRKLHNPVDNSILVKSHHRIILVEGNYLLLDTAPWSELINFFTETWFVDIPLSTAKERLTKRHTKSGRSHEEAVTKIASTDMPNAELIIKTQQKASRIIKLR